MSLEVYREMKSDAAKVGALSLWAAWNAAKIAAALAAFVLMFAIYSDMRDTRPDFVRAPAVETSCNWGASTGVQHCSPSVISREAQAVRNFLENQK